MMKCGVNTYTGRLLFAAGTWRKRLYKVSSTKKGTETGETRYKVVLLPKTTEKRVVTLDHTAYTSPNTGLLPQLFRFGGGENP